MDKNTHVAFYIPSLTVGGAQRVAVDIANGLNNNGFCIDLLLTYKKGEFLNNIDGGINTIKLDNITVPFLGIGGSILSIADYLQDSEPDLLISHMTYANLAAYASTLISNSDVKFIGVEHNTFEPSSGDLKKRAINMMVSRQYKHHSVVAVSNGVKNSLLNNTAAKEQDIEVLYNPIDIDNIQKKARSNPKHTWFAEGRKVILSVGRLEDPKDYQTLLRAFKIVLEERNDVRLIVAGTGPKKDGLKALAERLNISSFVEFPGFVENIYSYMNHSSVFVLSSRREGLPTVLIEALTCGCPIVSTDCPSGPEEILSGGKYGILTPVGDPRAMSDAIIKQLNNPCDSDKLVDRAKDFSKENSIVGYIRYINNILDDH